ncbi:patatin-like phospholipase domain-containing protein 4 isoform X3 [Suricata suricatta]|nr:patatin-like phospholipase domain-containing protein 4 isoform X3 [Suricata suricatta]
MARLRSGIDWILPPNAHELAHKRLYISITNAKTRGNCLASAFSSREDLIKRLAKCKGKAGQRTRALSQCANARTDPGRRQCVGRPVPDCTGAGQGSRCRETKGIFPGHFLLLTSVLGHCPHWQSPAASGLSSCRPHPWSQATGLPACYCVCTVSPSSLEPSGAWARAAVSSALPARLSSSGSPACPASDCDPTRQRPGVASVTAASLKMKEQKASGSSMWSDLHKPT